MTTKLTPAVHVAIRKDKARVSAFLDWCLREQVFPLRDAGGAVGPGFLLQTFDAEYAEKIAKFFKNYRKPKEP